MVLYAGNLGFTSALDDVLHAAQQLCEQPRIQFIIVGEGPKKQDYLNLAQALNLTNIQFLPFQPRERFPELLASADATLVTLNEQSATTSLPGKTFNYLACARPIIAVAPAECELSSLIVDGRCGEVVPPGNPAQLANVIARMGMDEARMVAMGHNGRELLEAQFSRQRCVGAHEQIFRQATGKT